MTTRDLAAGLIGAGLATLSIALCLRLLVAWAHASNGTAVPEALMVRRVIGRGRRAVRQKMGRW